MISTRDIKRKIKTIQNIQQMCRAMKTVSLVKLQKAEMRLAAARPFAERMARGLAMLGEALRAKFPAPEEMEEREAVVVLTSDKGMCGGYNSSVIRRAQQESSAVAVIPMGKKADRFFRRRENPIPDSLSPLGTEPTYRDIIPLADRLAEAVKRGDISKLRSVYGRFLHGTRSEIRADEIFPLLGETEEVIMEPAAPEMAEMLLGRYMRAALYARALESSASEHGARVAAMTAASDNAEEMINTLTMDYNRARQAGITKELLELAGSADALQ